MPVQTEQIFNRLRHQERPLPSPIFVMVITFSIFSLFLLVLLVSLTVVISITVGGSCSHHNYLLILQVMNNWRVLHSRAEVFHGSIYTELNMPQLGGCQKYGPFLGS